MHCHLPYIPQGNTILFFVIGNPISPESTIPAGYNGTSFNFNIFRFEKERDFVWNLSKPEIEELRKEIRTGYEFIKKIVDEGSCDVLIVDEIMGAHYNKFITTDEIIYLIKNKKESMELVLTGRDVPQEVIDLADLVTEMKMIKHPFEKGINAREGIEY